MSEPLADDVKRVRADTGPLTTHDPSRSSPERVWPWYLGGVTMLAAAVVIGKWDFDTSHASAATARAEITAPVSAPSPSPSPSTSTSPSPSPSPSPSTSPAPAPAAAPPLPPPTEPTVTLTPAPDRERAKELNSKGYAARKRGDHAAAVSHYREAMAADPYHVWSRYNLACELALLGKRQESLSLLEVISKIGGPDADRALTEHAPKDPDFDDLARDQRFRQLTSQPR